MKTSIVKKIRKKSTIRKVISPELRYELKNHRTDEVYKVSCLIPLCVDNIREKKDYLYNFLTNLLSKLKIVIKTNEPDIGLVKVHEKTSESITLVGDEFVFEKIGYIYKIEKIDGDQLFGIRQCISDMMLINMEFVNYCIEQHLSFNDKKYNIKKLSKIEKRIMMMDIIINHYLWMYTDFVDNR